MRLGLHFKADDPAAAMEPQRVFEAAWRLDEFGIGGEVIPTPGHTPGSASVFLDNGAALVGDLATGHLLFGYPAPPLVASDLALNFQSLRAILARQPQIVYVTHGGPFKPSAVNQRLKL